MDAGSNVKFGVYRGRSEEFKLNADQFTADYHGYRFLTR